MTFTAKPGLVTGFLGPNGAGKSTTMRLILGLYRLNGGRALIGGRTCRSYARPMREIGALLEATSVHPGRTAYHHLLWLAQTHGIGKRRIDKVLDMVGLSAVARRRVGSFSLGMPAARRGGRAAQRPGRGDAGRADERPRPGGHGMDTRCCAGSPTRAARCGGPADLTGYWAVREGWWFEGLHVGIWP